VHARLTGLQYSAMCIIAPIACMFTAERPQRGLGGESIDGSSFTAQQTTSHSYPATHPAGT